MHRASFTNSPYDESQPRAYAGRLSEHAASNSFSTGTKRKASLNITQRLERKLAQYNASQNVLKRWLFEIASWFVSAMCMGAIIGIYLRVNGEEMLDSGWLLTFSNVLGKIASAALIVPTSEALGQLKWNWFTNEKSRTIWDFETFDKASRGPWGAALLLFRTKGRSLAALGALLIVLLLAINTFFQQVVTYPDRIVLINSTGSLPRVVQYEPFYSAETFQGFETNFRDPDLRPIVGSFFVDNGTQPVPFGNGSRPDIPLSCPTSSCSWPPYETLGICSGCVEASHLLQFGCLQTNIDWSASHTGPIDENLYPYSTGTMCGYFLNATTTAPTLMSGYIVGNGSNQLPGDEALLVRSLPLTTLNTKIPLWGGSVNFKHIVNPILDALIVSASNGSDSVYRNQTPVAHECYLAWCVQTVTSSYSSGQYHQNISSVYLNTTKGPWPWPWESYPMTLESENVTMTVYGQNIVITPPSTTQNQPESNLKDRVFGLSNATTSNVMANFEDYFPSYYTATKDEKAVLRYKNYPSGPSLREIIVNPLLAPNNITVHMERLAAAMTNVVRSSISKEMLPGNAYKTEKVVSVRWEWLAFPFILLVLSLIFLISTIIKTSKDTTTGVWKTSTMPTLIYGLPKETQSQFTSSSTWKRVYETKKVRIRLLPNMGWRVSGHGQPALSPQLPTPRGTAPREWN
ncbi:Nn.00g044090.m01.CDS01 [Neocucurbitaria sp. VM-36]